MHYERKHVKNELQDEILNSSWALFNTAAIL